MNYTFTIEKTNFSKVFRTVRGSIKKAIFYCGVNIPYEVSEQLVKIEKDGFSPKDLPQLLGDHVFKVFEIDAKIRFYDDILDNTLARIHPLPLSKMENVIKQFESSLQGQTGDVAKLFRYELDILSNKYTEINLPEKITKIIEVRPCDYFLLIETLAKQYGVSLSQDSFVNSLKFYKEFQRLRDLLDDMMSVEEDIIKGSYNSIVLGKNNKISYHFFTNLVEEKFTKLNEYINKIHNHPNIPLFKETVRFWKQEYESLFKILLLNYYVGLDEFRKTYFMIKQL